MNPHRVVLKNTIFLYFRMIITLVVSLYATRVILQVLGACDYGVYNVIGGFVAMFSFLTTTMSNASTRFFSYEIGTKNISEQKNTFQVTFTIYILLVLVILILGETVGLWFVNTKLNIPIHQHKTAMYVYQFSLLALFFSVIRIPYNATIIAHEKMKFYAYLSIAEVVMKLGIIYLLLIWNIDKLLLYSILTTLVVLFVTGIYCYYSSTNFKECSIAINFNRSKFKEILSFSGWNLTSNMGDVLMSQGLNIILNIFFGPLVNAARGLAYNIKTVVINFVGNFQTASTPQITKHYAANEIEDMKKLVFQTSRISFILMLVITTPLLFCVNQILSLWLVDVPDYTNQFTLLVLIDTLVMALGGTLNLAIQARGKLKLFVCMLSISKLMYFIIAYLCLKFMKVPPAAVFYIVILNSLTCVLIKLYSSIDVLKSSFTELIKELICREFLICFASSILILPIYLLLYKINSVYEYLIAISSFIIVIVISFYLGLTKQERIYTLKMINNKIKKSRN